MYPIRILGIRIRWIFWKLLFPYLVSVTPCQVLLDCSLLGGPLRSQDLGTTMVQPKSFDPLFSYTTRGALFDCEETDCPKYLTSRCNFLFLPGPTLDQLGPGRGPLSSRLSNDTIVLVQRQMRQAERPLTDQKPKSHRKEGRKKRESKNTIVLLFIHSFVHSLAHRLAT